MAPVGIKFGHDARLAMLAGIDRLAAAVAVTLGPGGRTVLIEGEGGGPPRVTKDGVTVAESLEDPGRWAQVGLRLARRAAQTVGERVGDGTTTTVVLAQALAAEGLKAVAAGHDPMALKRALDAGISVVLAELRRRAAPVRGRADFERIATISANGDRELGRIVADAFDAVGADGVVTVEAGHGFLTAWKRVRGWQWEGGYVSPYFMTDPVTTDCVYENPLILLTEHMLESHPPLLKVLEAAVTRRRPLLIVAPQVSGEALQTLVANKVRNGLRVVAGKAPLFGDRRRAMMEDIAAVTGGRLVTEARGDGKATIDPVDLGSAERIILTRDATTIVGGGGDADAVGDRIASVRAEQGLDGNTPFHEKFLRERIARLTGGVAVVEVGGVSEAEIGERRDRAEDAASAVRAAAAEGILPGGGAGFVHAIDGLDRGRTAEERAACRILERALLAPAMRIAGNAGYDGREIASLISWDGRFESGFDATTGRIRNLMRAGVVDPAQVVIAALEAAGSIAGMLLATEAVVAKPPRSPRPTSADDIPFGPEAKDMTADEAAGFGLV